MSQYEDEDDIPLGQPEEEERYEGYEGEEKYEGEEEYYIETETTDLHTVDKALIATFGEHESSNFIWKPVIEATELSPELQIKFDKIIDNLEDIDDIQTVYHN